MLKIKELDGLAEYKRKLLILLLVTQLLLALAVPATAEDHKTIKSKIIDKRIEKGLYYLYENQLPTGEFSSYVSFSPDMSDRRNISIVFDTGLIIRVLNLVENNLADDEDTEEIIQEMRTKADTFLLNNMEIHGVWRFFGKNYYVPPDIDDSSVAFAALVGSGVNISNETLDYMLNYTTPDGRFYTYITSEEWLNSSNPYYGSPEFKNNSIDPNVNANALYAYSLKNRTQDGAIRYLNDVAENKSFVNGSRYYPSPFVFTYLVTKVYSDGKVKELEPSIANIKDFLLATQKSDGGWGNDMDTALATVSLLNIRYEGNPLETAIKHILNNQNKNGSWNIYSYYFAPGSPPFWNPGYFGSYELTTSVNIEALVKYKKTIDTDAVKMKDKSGDNKCLKMK